VLAYVFWHRPAAGGDRAAYEAALAGFHAALAAAAPAGYGGSCALALADAPWLDGGGPAYEDWYLVPSWAALGELNAYAVTGGRAAPHDAAAARAGAGAAGVYELLAGAPEPPAHGWRAWLAKPAGMGYPEFHDALAELLGVGAAAWQRQMTLGPAGEYVLSAPGPLPLPWPAAADHVRTIARV
jgi:hypothetical protein